MWKNSLTYSSINVKHSIVMCVSIYTNKCNMQHLNNDFNNFKMDDSTHVKMLIVQKVWKNLLDHWSIFAKHWITCISIYFNECKMQLVNNGYNILKVNGLTHIHMLIIEEIWKKSLICSNISVGFLIFTCVFINDGKYKM
jgi:hypothetical protein